jgi:hypothetical protein
MAEENKNSNYGFALIAIVAIVAIVALIILVLQGKTETRTIGIPVSSSNSISEQA